MRVTAVTAPVVLLLASLTPAAPSAGADAIPAQAGDVVINEIAASGPRAVTDGFFELRNTTDHPVDLSGFGVFRCDGEGLRVKAGRPETDLSGVVLGPGALFTVAHMSAGGIDADAVFTQGYDVEGYGLVLVDPSGVVADDIAVYPNTPHPTTSECGTGPNLPVTLAAALDESWQRTAAGDWVRARSTPSAANRAIADPVADAAVHIDEIAAAGPGGRGDDLVELSNTGDAAVDVSGWRLYRCTALGLLTADTLQFTFPRDSNLAPGKRYVIGGPDSTGTPDTRAAVSLADTRSGALLVDAEGRRVDGLAVSSEGDSACQTGNEKLPAELDHRTGQSWQRTASGEFVIAARTPGAPYTVEARTVRAAASTDADAVVISEIATDPELPDGHGRRNYVELANVSSASVDVSGWTLGACGEDGYRRFDTLATIPGDTRLEPGDTWIAALRGTPAAFGADATYEIPLAVGGAGAWLEDAHRGRVDSVGIYHRNEMDARNERFSSCTNGLALSTFVVDRLRAETYQRVSATGDDATDFVAAVATPGAPTAAHARTMQTLAAEARDRTPVLQRSTVGSVAAFAALPSEATELVVRSAVGGRTSAPLETFDAPGEEPIDATLPAVRDDGYDHPYVRLSVDIATGGAEVGWTGRVVGRSSVRLSVWNPAQNAWRLLQEATGQRASEGGDADSGVALSGRVHADEVVDGRADLLVQSVPRRSSLDAGPELGDPADYDVALSHITDTQYYSEAYPEVYAAEVAWIAANADARRIAFATHTGDLVQNWVDPGQQEQRARREFETASTMQAVLDDAGIPNSVLPGNHDNKRGVSNDLFNEYFGPDRYAGTPWYGGSFGPDDNRASFSTFEQAGAKFLMLSLPYAYGEAEVAWGEQVVAQHPDHNVVVSTHEHLTPKSHGSPAARSNSSRWLSRADLLWERVVEPNRNVVLVLSGHFHGIGAIVTEDAGGVPGHTVVEALADYQESRTHTGERATGFQRLLQLDLAGGRLAVDTFSVPLNATASHPYDYTSFVATDGRASTPSNEQPWNILAAGLQNRYTQEDDSFTVDIRLQYAKVVATDGVWTAPSAVRAR